MLPQGVLGRGNSVDVDVGAAAAAVRNRMGRGLAAAQQMWAEARVRAALFALLQRIVHRAHRTAPNRCHLVPLAVMVEGASGYAPAQTHQ